MSGQSGAGAEGTAVPQQFSIRRVNLRRMGFDAPIVPDNGTHQIDWENVDVRTQREARRVAADRYELGLTLYVHVTTDSGTAVQVTVEEVGTFRIDGYAEDEALELLRTKGAEQVYPYAREVLLSLVGRAGLQNFGLKPLGFDLPD